MPFNPQQQIIAVTAQHMLQKVNAHYCLLIAQLEHLQKVLKPAIFRKLGLQVPTPEKILHMLPPEWFLDRWTQGDFTEALYDEIMSESVRFLSESAAFPKHPAFALLLDERNYVDSYHEVVRASQEIVDAHDGRKFAKGLLESGFTDLPPHVLALLQEESESVPVPEDPPREAVPSELSSSSTSSERLPDPEK